MPCDPATLIAEAGCINQCIPVGMQLPVLILLAADIANVPATPQTLIDNAQCISQCVPFGLWMPALIGIACDIASGEADAPAAPLSLTINQSSDLGNTILDWTQGSVPPTSEVWRSINGSAFSLFASVNGLVTQGVDVAAGAPMELYCYKVRACNGSSCSSFTSEACAIHDYSVNGDAGLISVLFPDVVATYTRLRVFNCDNCVSISFPRLAFATGASTIQIINNDILTTVDFPSLTSYAQSFGLQNNPLLTTVNVPSLVFVNGNNIIASGSGLNATSINQILARGIASGVTACTFTLDGGTNAAPTGQGVNDKADLITLGNTVTTN